MYPYSLIKLGDLVSGRGDLAFDNKTYVVSHGDFVNLDACFGILEFRRTCMFVYTYVTLVLGETN
jgi:hypothetical protein